MKEKEAEEPDHKSTEDQVNTGLTVPQRIDKKGTKVEDVGGTGEHDAPGG